MAVSERGGRCHRSVVWAMVAALVAALLAALPAPPAAAAYPGGNGAVVFSRDMGGGNHDIWLRDANGVETPLTATPDKDTDPAWSPDGTKIAFGRIRAFIDSDGDGKDDINGTNRGDYHLWTMKADGTEQHRVTAPGRNYQYDPSWSPDGTELVYREGSIAETFPEWIVHEANNYLKIAASSTDGTGPRTVMNDSIGRDTRPAWSSTGHVAFTRIRGSNPLKAEIWTSADDAEAPARRLTSAGDHVADTDASWSPDGSRLVFSRRHARTVCCGAQYDIFVVNADGTGLTNLTLGSDKNEWEPAWSPDGSRIVFSGRIAAGNDDLYSIAADGTDLQRLTTSTTHEQGPDWQPAGNPPLQPSTLIDFDHFPGPDGVLGTGDDVQTAFNVPVDNQYLPCLGVDISLRDRTEAYLRHSTPPTINGQPVFLESWTALYGRGGSLMPSPPMPYGDGQAGTYPYTDGRPGSEMEREIMTPWEKSMRDIVIDFTTPARWVKLTAFDMDEPITFDAYSASGELVDSVSYGILGDTARYGMLVRAGASEPAITRVVVDITEFTGKMYSAGPELFDDLEFMPVEPLACKEPVGDRVWWDDDQDGQQDVAERGVRGVQVELLDANDVVVGTTTTSANGGYVFSVPSVDGHRVRIADSSFIAGGVVAGAVSTTGGHSQPTVPGADGDLARDFGYYIAQPHPTDPPWGQDNCPGVENPDQADSDGDGIGDACDDQWHTPIPLMIGDRVWSDLNQDGIQDEGEPGIPGVRVQLRVTGQTVPVGTVTTGADGRYHFSARPASLTYPYLVEVVPANFDAGRILHGATSTTGGNSQTVGPITAPAENNLVYDFGYHGPGLPGTDNCPDVDNPDQADSDGDGIGDACDPHWETKTADRLLLGDRVWHDTDADAVQDDSEPGIARIFVELLDTADSVIAGAATGADGRYAFAVEPGDYQVRVHAANFSPTGKLATAFATTASPLQSATVVDADVLDVDFGYVIDADGPTDNCPTTSNPDQADRDDDGLGDACDPLLIGDRVWDDADEDGTQDEGEHGIYGVVVELYQGTERVASTTTGGDGYYIFRVDEEATYTVKVADENFAAGGVLATWLPTTTSPALTRDVGPHDDLTFDFGYVYDGDGDGVPTKRDNCADVPNADQVDTDSDTLGNACDDDDDDDTKVDDEDNCPLLSNLDQTNTDGDALGDACDEDDDNDLRVDTSDNCPLVANHDQDDADDDGIGDVCDTALPGRMTGGGSVFTDTGERVTHGFTIHCDPEARPQRVEVNWGADHRFHMEELTYAFCGDNPDIEPEQPDAGFDTYSGRGTGRLDGVAGARIVWRFVDAGEPGTSDTVRIRVFNADDVEVLTVSGRLDRGNHQPHRS